MKEVTYQARANFITQMLSIVTIIAFLITSTIKQLMTIYKELEYSFSSVIIKFRLRLRFSKKRKKEEISVFCPVNKIIHIKGFLIWKNNIKC